MFNLIKNEWLKITVRKYNLIFLVVLLVLQLASAFIIRSWEPIGQRFPNAATYTQFNFGVTFFLLTMFSITLMVQSFSNEFQQGTIKQLLIRPRKRVAILIAKLVAVLTLSILYQVLAAGVSILFGGILFGWDTKEIGWLTLLKLAAYEFSPLLFYVVLACLLVVIFKTTLLPALVTLLLFLFQAQLVNLSGLILKKADRFFILKHVALKNYDSQLAMSDPPMSFNLITSVLFILCHLLIMLIIASLIFEKEDIL
ncbi:ABC transporter permease [Vagococcus sp.]|uniref:ABC transporter permease n=1 Tax=Vagococcus sp. TaxID=1933889 RepID=UPI003F9815E6